MKIENKNLQAKGQKRSETTHKPENLGYVIAR